MDVSRPERLSACDAARAIAAGSLSAEQLVQACLEAVCYRFARVARLLDPHLDESRAIVASGGALRASPAWVAPGATPRAWWWATATGCA